MVPERGIPAWIGPVVATGLALWFVHPVLGDRPPAGEDVMAHLVRADFGIPHLINAGRLDGWMPRFVLGQQEFLFNGPGLTWLMAAVRGVTLGQLSNTGALKVVCILAYAVVPAGVWFLARSYGLSRAAADFSAVFALCVSNPFGVGLSGLFDVGLVPHQLGATFFCLALGGTVRLLRPPADGMSRPWVLLTGAAVAALAVTHLISVLLFAVFAALTVAMLGAGRRLSVTGLRPLATAGAVSAGLAGFWLVPMLAHRDLSGVVTTWGTPPLPERLARILGGDLLFPTGFAIVVVLGWLVALGRQGGRAGALAWVAVPPLYLLVAHFSVSQVEPNDFTTQLANRGLGYAGLIAVLGAGALLAAAVDRLASEAPAHRARAAHLGALALALATVALIAPERDAARQMPEPNFALRDTAGELARRVPDGARFAVERDFPGEVYRTGILHPETWLARVSGRNSLNGFNLEAFSTPGAAFVPDELSERRPNRSANALARLGVSHVVTTGERLADHLDTSSRFEGVWEEGPMTIYRVVPRNGQPPPAALLTAPTPLRAQLVSAEPEHLAFAVRSDDGAEVTVALAWSPKWKATIDGEPRRFGHTADGLGLIIVPPGDSVLRLDYAATDSWDRAGVALTLGTVFTLLVARRRRRLSAERPGPDQPMSRSFSRTA